MGIRHSFCFLAIYIVFVFLMNLNILIEAHKPIHCVEINSYSTSTLSWPVIINSSVKFAVGEVQNFSPAKREQPKSCESPCRNQVST